MRFWTHFVTWPVGDLQSVFDEPLYVDGVYVVPSCHVLVEEGAGRDPHLL